MWRLRSFREARKERKKVYSRPNPCTEYNGPQRVLFSPADNTSGIPGEFKQIARSRDYYWKSRPRMLFKQRATWRERADSNRRKIALVVPRTSSPKFDPESARVREKVCFKFDRSSGIYSGIYVESTSCLSPRWHGLPFHETCQKRRARPPRRSRRKGGRASTVGASLSTSEKIGRTRVRCPINLLETSRRGSGFGGGAGAFAQRISP